MAFVALLAWVALWLWWLETDEGEHTPPVHLGLALLLDCGLPLASGWRVQQRG